MFELLNVFEELLTEHAHLQEDSDPQRYLRWADAFMVVYSITNRESFQTVRKYLENITQYIKAVGKELPVAIVGNKIDLERYR